MDEEQAEEDDGQDEQRRLEIGFELTSRDLILLPNLYIKIAQFGIHLDSLTLENGKFATFVKCHYTECGLIEVTNVFIFNLTTLASTKTRSVNHTHRFCKIFFYISPHSMNLGSCFQGTHFDLRSIKGRLS